MSSHRIRALYLPRKMRIKYLAIVGVICVIIIYYQRNFQSYNWDEELLLYVEKYANTKRRVERFCSPAYNRFEELVYFPKIPTDRLVLHAVAIIVRHGARSPSNQWRTYFNETKLHLCKTSNHNLTFYANSLKKVFIKSIPSQIGDSAWYPNSDECSSAQLTSLGSDQLFKLGKLFTSRYVEPFYYVLMSGKRRLTKTYRPFGIVGDGGYIYLRTTEYNRTFQSGIAFLAGMLGTVIDSFTNQTIFKGFSIKELTMGDFLREIVTISSTQSVWQCTDQIYAKHGMESPSCFCQKVNSLMKRKIQKRYDATEMEILNRGKHSTLSFYGPSTSLGAAAESIVSYVCNSINLPCFPTLFTNVIRLDSDIKDQACMTWEDVNNILEAIKVIENADLKDEKLILLDKLQMFPFLWEIWYKLSLSTLYEKDGDDKKPTFLIYPSHDTTIFSLLNILGLRRNLWWPAFSSSLIIELYSIRKKQFFIRVLYDGEDVTASLPFCQDHYTRSENMCFFENFSYYVLKELQGAFNSETYSEFCEH